MIHLDARAPSEAGRFFRDLKRSAATGVDSQAFMRLIRKWLKAGILEEAGQVIHPETGTPQGGIISPVLAKIYLHYALDVWVEKMVPQTRTAFAGVHEIHETREPSPSRASLPRCSWTSPHRCPDGRPVGIHGPISGCLAWCSKWLTCHVRGLSTKPALR